VVSTRFGGRLLGGALLMLCQGTVAVAAPTTNARDVAGSPGPVRRYVLPTWRPNIVVRANSRASSVAQYTLEDHGMPAANRYSSSSPLGFNDSGQIYGIAARKAKAVPAVGHVDQSCLVWTGAGFIDLEPSLTITNCSPYGMDSVDQATGSFSVVGAFSDIYDLRAPDAFSASIGSSGVSKLVSYYNYYPSRLFGISSKGVADGYSYNAAAPQSYQYDIGGPMFVTVAPEAMVPLQPANCASPAVCLLPVQSISEHQLDGEPLPQCAFGGCTINASGVVLGFDSQRLQYAAAQSGSAAPAQLLLTFFDGSTYNFAVALNDAGQLLYFSEALDAKHTVNAAIYDLASKTSLALPPVAGTNCAHYFPIAMNNAGEVLGYTSYCAQRDFYWTWDAVHGTQDISPAIPPNAYTITPLGINDVGQILASLGTATGTHWGTLDPPTAGPASHRTAVKGLRHDR